MVLLHWSGMATKGQEAHHSTSQSWQVFNEVGHATRHYQMDLSKRVKEDAEAHAWATLANNGLDNDGPSPFIVGTIQRGMQKVQ